MQCCQCLPLQDHHQSAGLRCICGSRACRRWAAKRPQIQIPPCVVSGQSEMAAVDPLRPLRLTADFVGAGLPANTGRAGAIHRVVCFAGKPAPTECA